MVQEKIKAILQKTKQEIFETFRLLWCFKWYLLPYLLSYFVLLLLYLSPSPKNYCIWWDKDWFEFSIPLYVAVTRLMLLIFVLLFLIGTSNMRNHPLLAKLVFLSGFYWLYVFIGC